MSALIFVGGAYTIYFHYQPCCNGIKGLISLPLAPSQNIPFSIKASKLPFSPKLFQSA